MSQPHHLFNLFASITNLCLISLQRYFFGILQGQEFVLSCLCDVEQNKLHINPFPNKPLFLRVCSTSLLKTLYTRTEQFLLFPQWGKGEIARYEEFLFSSPPPPPSVFYLYGELSATLFMFKIVVCELSQFGRVSMCCLGKG